MTVLLGHLLVGVLADHAHIAAQRYRGQAVFGLTAPAFEEHRTETQGEAEHLDPEALGCDEMPQFMEKDQRPQKDEKPNQRHDST